MKVGVFGDSFGFNPNHIPNDAFWVDVLSEKHDVTNYSKSGTNLYWSYTMLEKYASQFDYLILVVTSPYRFFIPKANDVRVKHACNLRAIEDLLNTNNGHKFDDEEDVAILDSLQKYMIHAMDLQQYALYHSLLVEKIKKQFSNILMLPSFTGCMDPVKLFTQGTSSNETTMGHISEIDLKYCNNSWEEIRMDKRNAHMSSENNLIFGREVLKYIEGDMNEPFNIDLSMYKKPEISKDAFRLVYFNLL